LILLAARHHSVTAADGRIGDHRHNHRSAAIVEPSPERPVSLVVLTEPVLGVVLVFWSDGRTGREASS